MDGTNYTKARRDLIRDRVSQEPGYEILWIESLLTQDAEMTEQQFEALKNSPDFIDKEDYLKRQELYKQNYETLTSGEGSFVKIYDDGRELVLHEIFGFLRTKIVSFLMNLHTSPRPVYLIRHGESEFNVKNLIGGGESASIFYYTQFSFSYVIIYTSSNSNHVFDNYTTNHLDSGLTAMGLEFSQALGDYLHNQELSPEDSKELCVWTSNMKRSKQTAVQVRGKKLVEWRALREIEVGICDGLSYDQVQVQFPEEFRARQHDKLKYRYPRGESYLDVITRLEV